MSQPFEPDKLYRLDEMTTRLGLKSPRAVSDFVKRANVPTVALSKRSLRYLGRDLNAAIDAARSGTSATSSAIAS